MVIVPLQAIPAQMLSVTLGGQVCEISVYQKSTGMFLDLSVGSAPILQGILCHDRVLLARESYLGFTGYLSFIDTEGSSDPTYSGLGSRYLLAYLTASDLV